MAVILSALRLLPGVMAATTAGMALLKMTGVMDWSWWVVLMPLAFAVGYFLGSPDTWRRR